MSLHPEDAVARFLSDHEDALALYGGYVELAVPKVFAKYEEEYPDASLLPGSTLCSGVRAVCWALARDDPKAKEGSLSLVNWYSTKLLTDGFSATVRILRHPLNAKSWERVKPTPPPMDTLFGVDAAGGYELAMLWTPDFKTKSLGAVVLAAVSNLSDATKTELYYGAPVPRRDVLTQAVDTSVLEEDFTWDDEDDWGDGVGVASAPA
jgi:hypothetical protein